MEMIKNVPILKQHVKLLENALKDSEHGTFYTFEELSEMARIDITRYRSVLESVKKAMLRDYNRLLISVRGKGYQVARPEQYSAVVNGSIKGIGRKVKGCKKIIEKIEWQKLDSDETQVAIDVAGKVAVLNVVMKTATLKELSKKVDWGRLPSEEAVVAFLIDRTSKKEQESCTSKT
jgi:hypothetical protein